ncbi:glycosyltransferase family 2 protein [Vibrio atlanticus]|uniref:Glycosyltransferase n=1 Tax=Vibrio atlanticus (strain LGP32) TaxID=575788 RepID=B7VHP0_VIBA3|nr:glycosyltransferase [Vibrio atlanticus]CAV17252.1 putative glycosyltransferase [Vibrio atlanticus]
MQKINLSIIIPVYNLEDLVVNCLNSVFNQNTSYNYEVIVIDDGSTDCSLLRINEFNKRSNVKIFSQKNAGLSATRNVGITQAVGEYISFVDADDTISPEFVEKTLRKAYLEKSDMVIFGIMRVEDNVTTPFYLPNKNSDLFTQVLNNAFAWNKIYKKDLLSGNDFIEGVWYEDLSITPIILLKAVNVTILPEYLYYYLSRPASITQTVDNPLMLNFIDALINVNAYIQGLPESEQVKSEFKDFKNKAKNTFLLRMLSGCSRRFIWKELPNIVLKFRELDAWKTFDYWKVIFSFCVNKHKLKAIAKKIKS